MQNFYQEKITFCPTLDLYEKHSRDAVRLPQQSCPFLDLKLSLSRPTGINQINNSCRLLYLSNFTLAFGDGIII